MTDLEERDCNSCKYFSALDGECTKPDGAMNGQPLRGYELCEEWEDWEERNDT